MVQLWCGIRSSGLCVLTAGVYANRTVLTKFTHRIDYGAIDQTHRHSGLKSAQPVGAAVAAAVQIIQYEAHAHTLTVAHIAVDISISCQIKCANTHSEAFWVAFFCVLVLPSLVYWMRQRRPEQVRG